LATSIPFVEQPNLSWRDWQVSGYTGLELWNYMSEFKNHLPNKVAAILFCYFPFRAVNTHILSQETFDGQLGHDKRVVYDALREGHCFVAYDLLGEPRGFRFTAKSGDAGRRTSRVIMGQEIALDGEVSLEVHAPQRADIRLLRDGRVMARRSGKSLRWTTRARGAIELRLIAPFSSESGGGSSPIPST
jgi:hypothetical protein